MSEAIRRHVSISLYLTLIEKNPKKFITFWNDERELLLERDAQGFRAIDAGPLTIWVIAQATRAPDSTRPAVSSTQRAPTFLHMLRMMMQDNRTRSSASRKRCRSSVNTYRGKAATTEDFKAIVEKHMTQEMDMEGNHKMDWFFNEYVYGTQLPSYQINATFDTGSDGDVVMNVKMTQSNVNDSFSDARSDLSGTAEWHVLSGKGSTHREYFLRSKDSLEGHERQTQAGAHQLLRRRAVIAKLRKA